VTGWSLLGWLAEGGRVLRNNRAPGSRSVRGLLLLATVTVACGALASGCTAAKGSAAGARTPSAGPTSTVDPTATESGSPVPTNTATGSHPPIRTGPTPTRGAPPAGYDRTACSLLTAGEVNTILGTHVTGGEPTFPTPPRGVSACLIFDHSDQLYGPKRGLRIDLWHQDDSRQLFASLIPSSGTPVTGLGDEAKGYAAKGAGAIAVRRGPLVVVMFASTPQAPLVTLAQLRALAFLALNRT
jgi:hypothetical protein